MAARVRRGRLAKSTIVSGAAEAVLTQPTTWSCCMLTVIGRSMCKNDRQKRPRPARGVREGLCMRGNFHVQFLGDCDTKLRMYLL